jgi:hypothetical protein
MSQLSLLIVASVGAALAFFVAGLLLRRPRASQPDGRIGPLQAEVEGLRTECARADKALAEAASKAQAQAEARQREEAARLSAERERDNAQAEHARLTAREKTLAERLRAAEASGRAALEQVEANAAAWDARWQAAQAERQRQEQALRQELDQLRTRHDAQAKDQAKLLASCQTLASEKANAERAAAQAKAALAEARAQSGAELAKHALALEGESARLVEKQAQLEAHEREVRASVEQSAAAWRQRLERAEADWQAKLAGLEAEWRAKTEAANSVKAADVVAKPQSNPAEVDRLSRALEQLRAEHDDERAQRQRLELVAHATEEALAAEQASAKSQAEALRSAEGRLRDLDRLARENADLRAGQAQLAEQAKLGVGREGEARDAKVELGAAQAKLAELGHVLEENRKLRDELVELRGNQQAAEELDRLTAAHKQLRLDAELMERRLQELKHDQAELTPLRAQAAEAASLQEEVVYLRRREKDLEAQLYASGFFASREMPAISGELLVQTPVSDMETSLDALLAAGGPRTAILADAQGFLIAGAGESVAQEGLAAFAAVAGDMVSRARMLLPLADVNSVRLTDANSMVLTCHLFDSDGQNLEIATLGPGEAPAEDTQRTIAGLAATLSGGGSRDNGDRPT